MKEFLYEGLREGKKVRGVLRARDKRELILKLKREGIRPIKLKEKKERSFTLFRKKVSDEELAYILLELSVLLSSGIPLTRAVELVSSQAENEELRSALNQVKSSLEKGENIAEAFRKTGIFPEFLSEMLTGVQRGENLEFIFKVAGEYLQKVSEFRSRLLSSITYPSVIILFSFISLFVAVKFVVPKIASVLEDLGKELPPITKAILFLSDLFTLLILLLPVFLILFHLRERFVSREKLHEILLKIPVIGKVNLYFNLSRFARVLSMLLEAGVPLNTALRISVKSFSNLYLRKKIEELIPQVERGKSFSSLLYKVDIPKLFSSLVETGEASGELEKMLELVAEIYEKQADRTVNFWLRVVEPLSILVIGITVGIIALSVILPLTEISAGLE
ncbi:type II secretion system F family protein [Aquifex pyrophilus]